MKFCLRINIEIVYFVVKLDYALAARSNCIFVICCWVTRPIPSCRCAVQIQGLSKTRQIRALVLFLKVIFKPENEFNLSVCRVMPKVEYSTALFSRNLYLIN